MKNRCIICQEYAVSCSDVLQQARERLSCATCKHWIAPVLDETERGECGGIVYDGGDVTGAEIDGDTGHLFTAPDFMCAGWTKR